MAEKLNIRLGTRGSALARWQTDHVARLLCQAWPDLEIDIRVFSTSGDRMLDVPLPLIGGKGAFTAELEIALHEGQIDCAVHSLKDLPTENSAGLTIGAVLPRAEVRDVLVSRSGAGLDALPDRAAIGTSSRRRAAQLLAYRPDFRILDIRGNVDTRIRKALDPDGPYDALVLAAAGLERLEQTGVISEYLSLNTMLPAPGQGALAIQCRDDSDSRALLAPLNHDVTAAAVTAERAFLAGLGGGCALPIAAYATVDNDTLHVRGRVSALDGSQQIDVETTIALKDTDVRAAGDALARAALQQGAVRLLEVQS